MSFYRLQFGSKTKKEHIGVKSYILKLIIDIQTITQNINSKLQNVHTYFSTTLAGAVEYADYIYSWSNTRQRRYLLAVGSNP